MSDINKILVIRLSSIGDIILTTPLIRALKKAFPRSVIDFVVKEKYVELVSTNPHLNRVLVFDTGSGLDGLMLLKRSVKREQYDLILDLHKNFRSIYLRTGSKAGSVYSYPKHYVKRFLLVKFGINLYKDVQPVFRRYFHAVETFNIEPDNNNTELHVPAGVKKRAVEILTVGGLQASQKIVALCPGAGFENKRWLPEGFAAVGDYFSRKHKALIALMGSAEDFGVCEQVREKMLERSVNFAGRFSLLEAAGALGRSSLAVVNDSGLMHLAQTQRIPVVALFGATVRELGYYPLPENSFIIEKNVTCRPCSHNGLNRCPKKHFRCMRDIGADEVISAGEQLLNSQRITSQIGNGQNLVSSL